VEGNAQEGARLQKKVTRERGQARGRRWREGGWAVYSSMVTMARGAKRRRLAVNEKREIGGTRSRPFRGQTEANILSRDHTTKGKALTLNWGYTRVKRGRN